MLSPLRALAIVQLACLGCLAFPALPDASTSEEDAALPAAYGEPATEPFAPPTEEPALRLGSWNVRRLGRHPNTDAALLARLIEMHFDILALVEVMSTAPFEHAGLDALLSELGPTWTAHVTTSPRPEQHSPFAEYYAVLFRIDRIVPCDEHTRTLLYHPDEPLAHDGGPLRDAFLREPAFGCYRLSRPRGFDFRLGVFHARWGTGAVNEITQEVSQMDEVLTYQAALYPGERDLLLVGDFNLSSEALRSALRTHDATLGTGSTLNSAGDRTQNLLDHMLVARPEETLELLGPAEVLDLRALAGSAATFVERVSDHLPIHALFRVDTLDDDG